MNTFLHSNETKYRLLRTIVQGIIGVIIANLDIIIEPLAISPDFKPVIVAIVMSILSPIMAEIGGRMPDAIISPVPTVEVPKACEDFKEVDFDEDC